MAAHVATRDTRYGWQSPRLVPAHVVAPATKPVQGIKLNTCLLWTQRQAEHFLGVRHAKLLQLGRLLLLIPAGIAARSPSKTTFVGITLLSFLFRKKVLAN